MFQTQYHSLFYTILQILPVVRDIFPDVLVGSMLVAGLFLYIGGKRYCIIFFASYSIIYSSYGLRVNLNVRAPIIGNLQIGLEVQNGNFLGNYMNTCDKISAFCEGYTPK